MQSTFLLNVFNVFMFFHENAFLTFFVLMMNVFTFMLIAALMTIALWCLSCVAIHVVVDATVTLSWGIISGTPVTFCRNSANCCPNLMILSALWTEIICVQAQTRICCGTLILLLHYFAKTNRSVRNYRTTWLLLYELSTNSQKLITLSGNV